VRVVALLLLLLLAAACGPPGNGGLGALCRCSGDAVLYKSCKPQVSDCAAGLRCAFGPDAGGVCVPK
jgi:hypothetical protein